MQKLKETRIKISKSDVIGLKEYFALKNKQQEINEKLKELKSEIVTKMKSLPGKNKDKFLKENGYEATLTYKVNNEWDEEKAKLFFDKNKLSELYDIKITFDNRNIEKYIEEGKLKKEVISKFRTQSWTEPNLYINKK